MAVRPFGLSPEQIRVLGALIEKSATTPETYPLSSNALRTACNQRSSRNPVAAYDESTVTASMLALRERELAKTVRGAGSRAFKHAHALDRLGLADSDTAALAVLLLRGPQTIGEIKTRCERQHRFASIEEVEDALSRLVAGDEPLVERLEREPGQKEPRWRHLLEKEAHAAPAPLASPAARESSAVTAASTLSEHSAPHDSVGEERSDAQPPARERLLEEADARTRTLEDITERIEALEASLAEIKRQLNVDEL